MASEVFGLGVPVIIILVPFSRLRFFPVLVSWMGCALDTDSGLSYVSLYLSQWEYGAKMTSY